jgi:hypothetical protein
MLWPKSVVLPLINVAEGQPLLYAFGRGNAASDFGRFRIAPGDTLVPVHFDRGLVCPIARMRVVYKGTVGGWRETHPDELPDEPEGQQLLAGEDGTPMYFGRPLPLEVVRALRYDAKAPRALKLDENGRLANHLGIEGVFRLCPESADEILWLNWI